MIAWKFITHFITILIVKNRAFYGTIHCTFNWEFSLDENKKFFFIEKIFLLVWKDLHIFVHIIYFIAQYCWKMRFLDYQNIKFKKFFFPILKRKKMHTFLYIIYCTFYWTCSLQFLLQNVVSYLNRRFFSFFKMKKNLFIRIFYCIIYYTFHYTNLHNVLLHKFFFLI